MSVFHLEKQKVDSCYKYSYLIKHWATLDIKYLCLLFVWPLTWCQWKCLTFVSLQSLDSGSQIHLCSFKSKCLKFMHHKIQFDTFDLPHLSILQSTEGSEVSLWRERNLHNTKRTTMRSVNQVIHV